MANYKNVKMKRIEKKYSKKIDKLLTTYQNKTMGELWTELDKLKAQMRIELEEAGLNESQ